MALTKLHLYEKWLGRKDSNLRYTVPKTDALPLGYSLKVVFKYKISGGGSRIRTYEVEDSGFTVRPSWPLWYPSVNKWWALTGSNRRPHACKACALPAELSAHINSW
jgi:hypothetical protein